MKSLNANAKGTKPNTQLRRNAMNFAKLTAIVFSIAGLVASGCSRDSHPVRPISDFSGDFGKTQSPDVVLTQDDTSTPDMLGNFREEVNRRLSLEVTLRKSEVEGGCWYLETAKGTRYQPYFGEDSPGFRVGQKLLVSGYVDTNMNTYCMIGPVFIVEKYKEIFTEPVVCDRQPIGILESESAASAAGGSRSANGNGQAEDNRITLKGYFGSNDNGCLFIYNEKMIIAELNFVDQFCPNIRNGASIVVAGSYSLLDWSPCMMASLFNVEKYEVIRRGVKVDVYSNEL